MAKLMLSDGGTYFEFKVLSYSKIDDDRDWVWCDILLEIHNRYMSYKDIGEPMDNREIDALIEYLEKLINGELLEEYELWCTEPTFTFKFFPSTNDMKNYYLDITIDFPSVEGVYGCEKWTVTLIKNEIIDFYEQLKVELENCERKNKESYEKKTISHLSKMRGWELSEEQLKDINDNINKYIAPIINEKEENKYLCAKVLYHSHSKLYTFFVDEICHNCKWYTEDSDKEVFVQEFIYLSKEELPVPIEKMKKIIPVQIKENKSKKIN